MSRSHLTDKIRGYTILLNLEFSTDMSSGLSTLILELVQDETNPYKGLRAEFSGVTNMCLENFGGITQLLLLNIEDIKDQQLDRIQYKVVELEDSSLSFMCSKIEISQTGDEF